MPQSTVEAVHTIGARPRAARLPPIVVIEIIEPERIDEIFHELADIQGARVVLVEEPPR